MSRVCACPRRELMDGMPLTAKYRHPESCRKRAYRAKVKARAEAAGFKREMSLGDLDMATGTGGRAGDAETTRKPRQRRRVELRVSYRKAVEALTDSFAFLAPITGDLDCRRIVEQGLRTALSPKQRELLNEQEAA